MVFHNITVFTVFFFFAKQLNKCSLGDLFQKQELRIEKKEKSFER